MDPWWDMFDAWRMAWNGLELGEEMPMLSGAGA